MKKPVRPQPHDLSRPIPPLPTDGKKRRKPRCVECGEEIQTRTNADICTYCVRGFYLEGHDE